MGHLKPNTCLIREGLIRETTFLRVAGWVAREHWAGYRLLGMRGPPPIMASSCRRFTSRCLTQLCGLGRFPGNLLCHAHRITLALKQR